jgi:uncharacterized protein
MHRCPALAFMLLSLAGLACAAPLPETTVLLGGQRYTVEVAGDDSSRMRGLMFRDSLAVDRGMLFVFEQEAPLAFWMKNTRIPLDILYFDAARRLVSIAADTPPCTTPYCPSYPSAGPARFVLELNAGHARSLGLQPGAQLLFAAEGANEPELD